MAELNLRTMTDDEKERLYYQAGMPEIAIVYAQVVDVQAENDEYQDRVEKMVDNPEYDKQVKLVEHLQDHIREADEKLSTLYDYISDDLKVSKEVKKTLLEMITAVELDASSEP